VTTGAAQQYFLLTHSAPKWDGTINLSGNFFFCSMLFAVCLKIPAAPFKKKKKSLLLSLYSEDYSWTVNILSHRDIAYFCCTFDP